MKGCNDKVNYYNGSKICRLLSADETVEPSFDINLFVSFDLKTDYTKNKLLHLKLGERYKHHNYAGENGILLLR
jgi:hypothetical protein